MGLGNERQAWENNWTFSASMGIGHRNNKKDPEGSGGQGGKGAFYLRHLKKTSCVLGPCSLSSKELLRRFGHLFL